MNDTPPMIESTITLTPEQLAEAAKNWSSVSVFLLELASKSQLDFVLMSKSAAGLWMQTGLFIDDVAHRLCAKVGDFPYQPLGLCGDGQFVPNAACKSFWQREFRYSKLHEAAVIPFNVVKVTLTDGCTTFSDAMLKQGEEVLAEMRSELDKLVAMTPEQRKPEDRSVREYIKLLCIKFPPMEAFISSNIQKNPDLKDVLDKVDPTAFLANLAEWLGSKVSDEQIRRKLGGLKMVREDLSVADTISRVLTKLLADPATSDGTFEQTLNGVYVVDPLLRETIDRLVTKQSAPRITAEFVLTSVNKRVTNG